MKSRAARFSQFLLIGCTVILVGCETVPTTRTYIAPMTGARQTHTAQQAEIICSARAQGAGSQAAAAEAARQQSQNNFGSTISGNCVRVGNILNCSGQQTPNSGGPLVGFLQGAMQGLEDSAASNSAYTACLAEMGFESRTVAVSSSNRSVSPEKTTAQYRYNSGVNELKAGRYKEASAWFELAAYDNHPPALYNLGLMYMKGDGVDKDANKGLSYIRRAADLGHESAKRFMSGPLSASSTPPANQANKPPQGRTQQTTQLPPQKTRSGDGIKDSAEAGNNIAQLALGNRYANEKNFAEAHVWWQRAAAGNVPGAYASLCRAYRQGNGVEKDNKKALEYCAKGAELGDPMSLGLMGVVYMKGMPPQYPMDQQRGIELLKRSARAGHDPAIEYLKRHGITDFK